MKEFDIASYQRKWQGAIGIALKGNDKVAVRYDLIEPWRSGDGDYIYARTEPFGETFLHAKPRDANTPVLEPIYYPFDTGVYVAKDGGFIILSRQHRKSYTCGITSHSFHVNPCGMTSPYTWDKIHWLGPVLPKDYNGKEIGYISRKIWWQGDRLFYLNTIIGYITQKVVKVNNALYIPYLRSVFKKCQIEVL